MIIAVKNWFSALSRREQVLIAIMGIMITTTLLFYAVARPLSDGMDHAQFNHEQMVKRNMSLKSKLKLLGSVPAEKPQRIEIGNLLEFIRRGATEQGFELAIIKSESDGRVAIAISSARPSAFLTWLSSLEGQGVYAEQLSARPAGPSTISATVTFFAQ